MCECAYDLLPQRHGVETMVTPQFVSSGLSPGNKSPPDSQSLETIDVQGGTGDLGKPRIFVDPGEECVELTVSFRCCTQNSVLIARATRAVGPDH